ncbi:MAG TPA: hypothetical protein VH597_17665 [Verrucomicrobiae bacterium]|jgi:hypothetical protein|nr:hypothetical protein [Verrucomicrobiae bacterium]
MKTYQAPTEKDRAFASEFARTICEHLQEANVSPSDIHEAATRPAGDLGKLLTTETTTDFEQLLAAAVDDHLFAPGDNETVGEDHDNDE